MKKILVGSLVLAILHSILFYGQELGISVLLYMIPLTFLIIIILKEKGKIKNTKPLILSIPILILSMTYVIFNNQFFYICNMIAIIILLTIMIILSVFESKNISYIIKKIVVLLGEPFSLIDRVIKITVNQFFETKESLEENKNKYENFKKIILGIVISLPILIIILLLLTSADTIFANGVEGITNWIESIFTGITIREMICRIALIIMITIYLASFIYNIIISNPKEGDNKTEGNGKFSFDSIVINTILTGINLIYLVFCYIQITNLFMGYTSLPSTGYAEYARQGFFQLMVVSLINLIIILITTHNEKIGTNRSQNYTKVMNLLLAIFTFIILISSFMRMYLYEQEFGYTFLRLMVYMILITEAILMIPTIIHIFNKKISLIKPYFTIILIMYIVVNYMNIDGMIARKNIDRYFTEENIAERKIDFTYLKTTGIDGAIEIKELLKTNDEELKREVNNYLYEQKNKVKNINWQEFNIDKYRLSQKLKEIKYDKKETDSIKENNSLTEGGKNEDNREEQYINYYRNVY